jgi:hypothetical protein
MSVKRKKATAPSARMKVAAARKGGRLIGSAVERLINRFKGADSADAFATWRMNPDTQLFIDALRECAIQPSIVNQETDSYEVQYGLTSGLQLSAMILDDPSMIFTGLFGATPSSAEALQLSYDEPPDGTAGA